MDDRIEKEIYKELSRIMTQDMQCECEVVKVKTVSADRTRCLANGTCETERLIVLPEVVFKHNGVEAYFLDGYANKMWSEYQELYEKYKDGDVMKVLFVSKKNRARVDAWYNYMDVIKKHRKVCVICDSPLEFCHKFNADKMGAAYTMFYFDEDLEPADICACADELKHYYNVEDFKYIMDNKLRKISVDDMFETNDMSKFHQLIISDTAMTEFYNEESHTIDEKAEITKEMYANLEARVVELEKSNKEYKHQFEESEKQAKKNNNYIANWMNNVDDRFNAIKKAVSNI